MSVKNVTKPADLISTEHWAVLNYTTIRVPGYDKGDPDESKDVVEYITFSSKSELESWIKDAIQGYNRKTFSVIQAKPAKIETSVSVAIK